MTALPNHDLTAIVNQVRSWPAEERQQLAVKILETIDPPVFEPPPMTMGVDQIIGIARGSGPPPDDEECRRILESERLRKFG